MLIHKDIITKAWSDYELLDSGGGRKLERFGPYIIDRPDAQAIWSPATADLWQKADARFTFSGKEGQWTFVKEIDKEWPLNFESLKFILRFGNFKHLGLFPEHSAQWQWLAEKIVKLKEVKPEISVLNLFGYTGAATLVMADNGAKVTHVDSSKQSVSWASQNADLSGLPKDRVRWIIDDATTFVRREVKRGAKYDGIVLDPPAFGRGNKGQVWHIEDDLLPLLIELKSLMTDESDSFLLLSGYAAGFAPQSFKQVVESVFTKIEGTYGSLCIEENEARVLPTGIYVRLEKSSRKH